MATGSGTRWRWTSTIMGPLTTPWLVEFAPLCSSFCWLRTWHLRRAQWSCWRILIFPSRDRLLNLEMCSRKIWTARFCYFFTWIMWAIWEISWASILLRSSVDMPLLWFSPKTVQIQVRQWKNNTRSAEINLYSYDHALRKTSKRMI